MNVKYFELESEVLKDNPLKDPYRRKTAIIEPDNPEGKPIIVILSGFGGSSISLLNYNPLRESLQEMIKRLENERKMKGSIIILPDMFTKVGGNQYINSPAVGRYEDYLMKELIPQLLEKYNSERFGIMGKSSGGYGSIVLGMKYGIQAIADHSGDSYFEYCYLPDFPKVIPSIRKVGGPMKWVENYWKKENRLKMKDLSVLNIIAMAAFYSSDNNGEVELPFDLETGEIIKDVWKKWKANDPVEMIEEYHNNLKNSHIFMDVGTEDEFNIQFGMRILSKKMDKLKVKHSYEEFQDGHMNISYRYSKSLEFMDKALGNSE